MTREVTRPTRGCGGGDELESSSSMMFPFASEFVRFLLRPGRRRGRRLVCESSLAMVGEASLPLPRREGDSLPRLPLGKERKKKKVIEEEERVSFFSFFNLNKRNSLFAKLSLFSLPLLFNGGQLPTESQTELLQLKRERYVYQN